MIETVNTNITIDQLTQEHINEMYKAYKNANLPINENETPEELSYVVRYLNLFGEAELGLTNKEPEYKLVISKYIDEPSTNVFIQTYIKTPEHIFSKTSNESYANNLRNKFK